MRAPAFTGPYSDYCRRHFSSAPRSIAPTQHRRGANQTADRARDRFGARGVQVRNGKAPITLVFDARCHVTYRRLGVTLRTSQTLPDRALAEDDRAISGPNPGAG